MLGCTKILGYLREDCHWLDLQNKEWFWTNKPIFEIVTLSYILNFDLQELRK